jgi:hypothetical protein
MTLVGSIGGSLCIFGGDHILVENVKSLPGPGPGIMVMGIVRHSGFKNSLGIDPENSARITHWWAQILSSERVPLIMLAAKYGNSVSQ